MRHKGVIAGSPPYACAMYARSRSYDNTYLPNTCLKVFTRSSRFKAKSETGLSHSSDSFHRSLWLGALVESSVIQMVSGGGFFRGFGFMAFMIQRIQIDTNRSSST